MLSDQLDVGMDQVFRWFKNKRIFNETLNNESTSNSGSSSSRSDSHDDDDEKINDGKFEIDYEYDGE